MIYAYTAWEFAADTHLMKLQLLQNKVLRIINNFLRRTPDPKLHQSFIIAYTCIYDYIKKKYADSKQKSGRIMRT
jgi:hypothetical protein